MSYFSHQQRARRASRVAAVSKQGLLLAVAVLLLAAAGSMLFRQTRGDTEAADRAKANSDTQARVQQIQSDPNMPPQAKAAALSAIQAHGGEAASHR